MKIKERFRLNTIISLGTVLLILISLGWSFRVISSANREMTLIVEMRKVAFERTLLRDEFLLHQEQRPILQWHAKSAELRNLFALAEVLFVHGEEERLLHEARKSFDATFAGLTRVMERQTTQAKIEPGFSEAELRQISQVFLHASSLAETIGQMHGLARNKMTNAWNRGGFIVVFITLGGIVAIIINSTIIDRTLTRRIVVLDQGVKILGAGNLDHRIAVEGDDELTALALASNEMAIRLQASYVSNEALQEEVAARLRSEKQLKATLADLQRSNKELEQFAYVASHDLQEPLRMVSSYTQLLAERYQGQLDDKADKFIRYAVDGAVRMQLLINDLLAYSRVGTRGKPPEAVDTRAVVDEALSNLKMHIEEAQALITTDELPTVRGDASQLVLLMQNLIGNAVKFRREQAPLIHIDARDQGGEWLFAVRDNGIGIEAQYVEKIFVIFQRLHAKDEYPGSGIGLAICKKIVERHGGRIWFESAAGQGTTFYFTLPK